MVTPDELARITAILHEIQPHADIVPCDFCDIDLNTLINTRTFNFDKVATSARWIEAVEGEEFDDHDDDHDEDEHHEHDHDEHDHDDHDGHHHHHHHHGLENEESARL